MKEYPRYAIEVWGGDRYGSREYFHKELEAREAAGDVIEEMNADGIVGHVRILGAGAGPVVCLDEVSAGY